MTYQEQPMEVSLHPYDYHDVRGIAGSPSAEPLRPPHPVTMMIKRVIKAIVDLLELPPNPLDQLTHLCGGREVVAEMTGRAEMMECQPDGTFLAAKRAKGINQQELNITVRSPAICARHAFAPMRADRDLPALTICTAPAAPPAVLRVPSCCAAGGCLPCCAMPTAGSLRPARRAGACGC